MERWLFEQNQALKNKAWELSSLQELRLSSWAISGMSKLNMAADSTILSAPTGAAITVRDRRPIGFTDNRSRSGRRRYSGPNAVQQVTGSARFFDTGLGANNNLALSFANDNVWGRISVSDLDREGIVPNTEYSRRNIGVRLNSNITSKLQVDVSGNYVNSGSGNVPVIGGGGEGLINNMYWGMNNYDYNDFADYWLPGQEGVQQNYFLTWGTNPFLIVNENLNMFDRNRLFGNIKASYQISENLSGFVRIGTDFYDDRRQSQRPSGQPNFPNGMYREQNIGFQETNVDFLLTYINNVTERVGLKSAGWRKPS